MIQTHGLCHVALTVHDAQRSFAFYRELFGMVEIYRSDGWIQAQTPGSRDVLVFEQKHTGAGKAGGVRHFGFRLVEPGAMVTALADLERLGAEILRQGEWTPGEPYVFFRDPDGYEVELWFEPPTPVDPR